MDDLKEQHNSHTPNGFMQDTPPRADVDEILRRKRKAREYKVRGFVGPVCVYVCGKSNVEEETARAARATRHAAEELSRESVFTLPNRAMEAGAFKHGRAIAPRTRADLGLRYIGLLSVSTAQGQV